MTATFAEIYNLRINGGAAFNAQVQVAIAKKCQDIFYAHALGGENEPPAAELAWAERAIADVPGMTATMLWAIVSNAGICDVWCNGAESRPPTDAEVQAAVNAMYTHFL